MGFKLPSRNLRIPSLLESSRLGSLFQKPAYFLHNGDCYRPFVVTITLMKDNFYFFSSSIMVMDLVSLL
jgi:hypothetical protein